MAQLERSLDDASRAKAGPRCCAQGIAADTIRRERRVSLKYKGTDTALEVPFG